jgi:hypothetical protein
MVMDIVTALGIIECLGIVANMAEVICFIGLLQDSPSGILWGINFQGVRTIRVGLLEDWVTQDNLLESLNGGCVAWGPDKGGILLCQLCQRLGDISEASDKGSLIAKDTEHALDLLNGGKLLRPSGQAIAFHQVDADGTVTDDDAQVINRGSFKFTLGRL